MRIQEQINPAILVWARESAGLNLRDAARKLALGDSKDETGEDKLLGLERGVRFPTRNQLNKIAKAYRRPLITFYMADPPQRAHRGEDFRSTGREVSARENALLDALLRDLKTRQEMVRDLLEDLDEAVPKSFVGSAQISDEPNSLAERIVTLLDIPNLRTDWGNTADEFFKRLRTATENIGVFVLLSGDLGSHHSALSEEVFRGFAVADPIAPFIVINDHDARTARSFTLIHEVVHILVGQSGVSGDPQSVRADSANGRVEQYCNDVAGRVLLPLQFADRRPAELADGTLSAVSNFVERVAKRWLVSEPLVAFRLRRVGWISPNVYRELSSIYAKRWASVKERSRAANQLKEGGPDYYVVQQNRLGAALVDVVRRTLRENRVTHTKAARVLGVKPSSVEPLLRRYEKFSVRNEARSH